MSSTIQETETAGYQLPKQKISTREKTEEWGIRNIDASLKIVGIYGNTRRQLKYAKQTNYDLFNGKFNKADLEYSTNPLGIQLTGMSFPANIQPYDCWNPIFNTLIGEEAKRPNSFVVRAVNDDAISSKEKAYKEEVIARLQELLSSAIQDPKQEIDEELLKYSKESYQDMRESIATKILTYLKKDLRLDDIFQKGWEDALIAGEEFYAVETFAGEPRVRRINPLEIYVQLPHNSDQIDEAEMIVEETFFSISQILDMFYEELTPKQIDDLESRLGTSQSAFTFAPDVAVFDSGYANFNTWSSIYDNKGNIRVYKVTWKSKKKVGKLRYIDPETGEIGETLVSEEYKIDKSDPNQSIEWLWINQYWEGYKVGTDMYLKIGPKKLQYRRMDNISSCKSGYFGTIYNCNNSQSVSLMDRLKPFIYLYIVTWYNTELAMSTNFGKIALIDLATIPDGWEIDKWMYYARYMKMGFTNSFNEGKKGSATGKLAGNLGHSGNSALDLETGRYIDQHIKLLEFIETKIQNLAGVSTQRMGQVSPSELVGNVQQATNNSMTITERWFQVHNGVKQRVLEALIEAAKTAWENKSKKVQYVLDDMSTVFFSIDGNEFMNSEYGVFISNSIKDQEALNIVKELMHAAIQNDKADLSSVMDVLNSESIADIRAKLLVAEEKTHQRQQEMQKQQLDAEKQIHDEKLQSEQANRDLQQYIADTNNQTRVQVAQISALSFDTNKDEDNNGIPDVIEQSRLALEQRDMETKHFHEQQKLMHDINFKNKELSLKEKELESKQQVEKTKLDQTKVQNKNQIELANKKAKLDEKMANKKIELEKIKARQKNKKK